MIKTTSTLLLLSLTTSCLAQQLNDTLLNQIQKNMNTSSTASWEIGTRIETLLELDFPDMTVFSSNYLTPTPPTPAQLSPVLSIAGDVVNSRTNNQLVADGAAGDPASIGCGVLLGNYTSAPGANWATAAQQQLTALLTQTPRSVDGAISHRLEEVQLWSDFIYMVPPFLAYYGVLTSNTSLIEEAYNQIKLYRRYLYDSKSQLWKHISMAPIAPNSPPVNGETPPTGQPFNDTGHWSTGNGWAAGGMLRVIGTIQNSPFSNQFNGQVGDLLGWVEDIHQGMTNVLPSTNIFPNYADQSNSFPDASGTAMFAATVYRAMTLYDPDNYGSIVAAAEKARNALYANNGSVHFSSSGWLQPVVNPNSFTVQGNNSPEAQAFVLQMNNNWQAWKNNGGTSAATRNASTANIRLFSLLAACASLGFWLFI